jgi:hypothetical protein
MFQFDLPVDSPMTPSDDCGSRFDLLGAKLYGALLDCPGMLLTFVSTAGNLKRE